MKKLLLIIFAFLSLAVSAKDWIDINEGLCYEVQNGSIKEIRKLIRKGADVNYIDCRGNSVFYIAVLSSRLDAVKLLVESGADITEQNSSNPWRGLTESMYLKNRRIFEYLLTIDTDWSVFYDKKGYSLYHFIIREYYYNENNDSLIKLFETVRKNHPEIDINQFDKEGNSALYYVMTKRYLPSDLKKDIILFFIDNDADWFSLGHGYNSMKSKIYDFDETSRDEIFEHMRVKTVQLHPDNIKLMDALKSKNYVLFRKILDEGRSDPYYPDYRTGLSAVQNIYLMHDNEALKAVIDSRADLRKKITYINGFFYAIHLACSIEGSVYIEKCIKNYGMDIDVRDWMGNTPLMYAAWGENKDAVLYLIEKGADLNLKNNQGETVLHVSVKKEAIDIIEILIKSGADINAVNRNGSTPLDIAVLNENISQIKLLQKYGAVSGEGKK